MTALVEIIHQLKPAYQDMLVWSLRNYLQKDVHRGTLPFVTMDDALQVIKRRYEKAKAAGSTNPDRGPLGEQFFRQLISILESAVPYVIAHDEVSHTAYTDDAGMKHHMQARFDKKCCLIFGGADAKIAQLEQLKLNTWKVTTKPEWMAEALHCLHEISKGDLKFRSAAV